MFTDASKEFKPGKNQNTLEDERIQKIVDAFVKHIDVDKFVYVADMSASTSSDASSLSSALGASSTFFPARFYMSLRGDPSSTDTTSQTRPAPPSSMICCLGAGNPMTERRSCPVIGLSIYDKIIRGAEKSIVKSSSLKRNHK